ncbi:insecticidal toxin complex protein [uncultured Gammaproteobacteria bacterium]|jgi:RHS repeat-associated protein|nr:insecticidal toxin complex protein [uncultured Gammaproteobacteria bacterium]SHN89885.1 insecticidal toxin complex protein [bacterium endosymbiont of Bathymodiolus sp. 5 South]CAC9644338.1 insecticidal toxin complex protein [uncultured Gammaproteobacteria bacterium]SSC06968.1 insecticidal toxin complex protein [bacterium endosymbiont of Bathymodiolus sp. 5 South]VVH56343.1 insecticidal toxin complex protein [uncultured Gammaproteobacteria bacterium]
MPLYHIVISLEPYQQTYAYDTGNNLTLLSHQANSGNWQQTLSIHPNNNRGTQTQQSTNDFDTNGNLLNLNNIGSLKWCYNNSLNQLTKADKPNTTQYYIYDYQGRRVRTVTESNHQVQNQRNYLLSLDISTNQAKQQSRTLHIGTHILSESSKDNTQTRYQLANHLQSNTLELDDKAQTLSYEHYYPYGGTAIIAGKDKIQVQQKRYRYTGKERDDSSGLSYYGARYLAPWLARWISPDAAGSVAGSNLYVYAGNNPLKYIDPTGHFPLISWGRFVSSISAYKANQRDLNIWVGETHDRTQGRYLLMHLAAEIEFQNLIIENTNAIENERPERTSDGVLARYTKEGIQALYPQLTPEKIQALTSATVNVQMLATFLNADYIGRYKWRDRGEYKRMRRRGSFKGSSLFLVGASHTLTNVKLTEFDNPEAYPAFKYMCADSSIAVIPKSVIDEYGFYFDTRRTSLTPYFGVWVEDPKEGTFLVHGSESIMREIFGNVIEKMPAKLIDLSAPEFLPCTILNKHTEDTKF